MSEAEFYDWAKEKVILNNGATKYFISVEERKEWVRKFHVVDYKVEVIK